MADITNRRRREIFSLSTSDDDISLLTINNPSWLEPRRYASRGPVRLIDGDTIRTGVWHEGEFYDHSLISALLPDDSEGDGPTMPIVLDNVELDAGALVEEDLRYATFDLVVVSKSDPDDILDVAYRHKITDADVVNEALTFNIVLDPNDATEPACPYRMVKQALPGLFL